MLFLVLLGLFIWALTAFALEAAARGIRVMRRRHQWHRGDLAIVGLASPFGPFSILLISLWAFVEGFRRAGNQQSPRVERWSELSDVINLAAAALYGFVFGYIFMIVALPFWQVTGWVVGLGLLAGSWLRLRFYRRQYISWRAMRHATPPNPAGFNHGRDILAMWLEACLLALFGIVILVAAL